jgi:hypothetical protein
LAFPAVPRERGITAPGRACFRVSHPLDSTDLRWIFCAERKQCVWRDLVVEHDHRRFRLAMGFENDQKSIQKVVVSEWLHGSLHILAEGMELPFQEICSPGRQADKLAM